MYLASPDKFLDISTTCTIDDIRFYSALLLRQTLTDLAKLNRQVAEYDYKLVAYTFINDLIMTDRSRGLTDGQLDDIIRAKKQPGWVTLDYDAFPDTLAELPYDEILGTLQGALHGLHHLVIHDPCTGYFSPGQVLDMAKLFEFNSLSYSKLGNVEVYEDLEKLRECLTIAAQRGDALLLG
jgi:hypothetical protein